MDGFVKNAFEQANKERAEAEARAFASVLTDRGEHMVLASIVQAGLKDLTKIFDWAMKNGLDQALHLYESALMFAGFHEGLKTKLDIE